MPQTPIETRKAVISLSNGDNWMCYPGDEKYMPVDKTWGIMPPSGMCPSILGFLFHCVYLIF